MGSTPIYQETSDFGRKSSAARTEHRRNGLSPIFTTLICAGHGLGFIKITIQQPLIRRMETFTGSARCAGCQTTRGRVFYLVLVLGVAMFIVGCGKKSENPPAGATMAPPQSNQAVVPPSSPAPGGNSQPVPAAAPATNTDTASTNLKELNHALTRWVVQNHQRPTSFEDFVARSNIQVPPPPAGKKYVIKRGFIVLENQSSN